MAARLNWVHNPAKAESASFFPIEDASTLSCVDEVFDSNASMMNRNGYVRHISTDGVPPTIDPQDCDDTPPWNETGESPSGNSIPMVMVGTDSQPTIPFQFPLNPHEESPTACANPQVLRPTVTPEITATSYEEPVEVLNLPTQFPSYDSMGTTSLQPRWSIERGRGFECTSQDSFGQYSAQMVRAPFSIPRSRLQYLVADKALTQSLHSETLSETPAPSARGPSNEVAKEVRWLGCTAQHGAQVKLPVLGNQHALVRRQDEVLADAKYDPLFFLDAVRSNDVDHELNGETQAFFADASTTITDGIPAPECLPTGIDSTGQIQTFALQGTPFPFSVAMAENKLLPCETLIECSKQPGGEAKSKQLPAVRLGRGANTYNRGSNVHYRDAVRSMSTEYKDAPARSKWKKKIVMDIIGNYEFEFQEKNGHWEKKSCLRYLKKKVQLDLRKARDDE